MNTLSASLVRFRGKGHVYLRLQGATPQRSTVSRAEQQAECATKETQTLTRCVFYELSSQFILSLSLSAPRKVNRQLAFESFLIPQIHSRNVVEDDKQNIICCSSVWAGQILNKSQRIRSNEYEKPRKGYLSWYTWLNVPGLTCLGYRTWVNVPGLMYVGYRTWVIVSGLMYLGYRIWVIVPGLM